MTAFKTLLFTIFVPGTVVVAVPYFLLRNIELFSCEIGKIKYFGLVPIFVGGFICLWCVSNFAIIGKGTPAPIDPPKNLVVNGPHKIVRNPMYVGVLILLIGEGILFKSATLFIYAFVMWIIFNTVVILYEEPTLRKKFGKTYEEYLKAVPRWIPRINK